MTPPCRLRSETEEQFQWSVIELAEVCGWSWQHQTISRRSNPGWPDLVLVREPVILFRELKTERGKVTKAQQEWLDRLTACGLDAGVWRPSDFYTLIVPTLRRRYPG